MCREYSEMIHAMRGEEVNLTLALVLLLVAIVQVGCATVPVPNSPATPTPPVSSGPASAPAEPSNLGPAQAAPHEKPFAAEPAPAQQPREEPLRANDASPPPDIARLQDAVRLS